MPRVGQKNQHTQFIGIDPGKRGGIATIVWAGGPEPLDVFTRAMPKTFEELWDYYNDRIVRSRTATYMMIERVHVFPRQGIKGAFTFGLGYGGILMSAAVLDRMGKASYASVNPEVWMKALRIKPKRKKTKQWDGETKDEYKNRLLRKAERVFPGLDITLDVADALLIAEYGRRMWLGSI